MLPLLQVFDIWPKVGDHSRKLMAQCDWDLVSGDGMRRDRCERWSAEVLMKVGSADTHECWGYLWKDCVNEDTKSGVSKGNVERVKTDACPTLTCPSPHVGSAICSMRMSSFP